MNSRALEFYWLYTDLGLTLRKIGELYNVSHQRVHQMIQKDFPGAARFKECGGNDSKRVPLYMRFLRKIQITELCWIWTAATMSHGYGHINDKGNHIYAHRYSYEFFVGEIPDGMHVLHSCDNPACVNPAHLFLGTHADNMHDRDIKGRNGHQRLSDEEVVSMRADYLNENLTYAELARRYQCSYGTAYAIIVGRTYKRLLEATQ